MSSSLVSAGHIVSSDKTPLVSLVSGHLATRKSFHQPPHHQNQCHLVLNAKQVLVYLILNVKQRANKPSIFLMSQIKKHTTTLEALILVGQLLARRVTRHPVDAHVWKKFKKKLLNINFMEKHVLWMPTFQFVAKSLLVTHNTCHGCF